LFDFGQEMTLTSRYFIRTPGSELSAFSLTSPVLPGPPFWDMYMIGETSSSNARALISILVDEG